MAPAMSEGPGGVSIAATTPHGDNAEPAAPGSGAVPGPVAVLGATSRTGAALCAALLRGGVPFRPVLRDPARWRPPPGPAASPAPAVARIEDADALRAALGGAAVVVSTAHAQFSGAVIAAAPPDARLVLMGSTRRTSRWPDALSEAVRAGEAAFLAAGRPGVMLHPTLIYGGGGAEGDGGDDSLRRLAALLRRLPVVPLPDGGRALVQPVHQSDVTRALLAAAAHPWRGPEALVVAGPRAVPYRDLLAAVARAAGLRPRPVLPVPAGALRALAALAARVPGLPRVGPDEVRRLTEDKAFDVGPLRAVLGVEPMGLEEGLALTFGRR